ncbi:hypothetical protein ACH42_14075 [Endozoicomonas sp. (ex Bugula neritina AB1)]|nr:hypothetical protein ACH42_14075 [Endozoicomonas sp. (ex Bugula neritina AB1)]
MPTVIDRIINDHQHLTRLLKCLDYEIAGYREETNYTPQLPIIIEALDYMHHYPDAFHHPLESRLMARLRAKLTGRNERIQFDMIEEQHKQITAMTQKLIDDFNTIASDQIISINQLLAEYALYSELQKDHMENENRYMIPAMKELLTPEDLAIVEDDFKQMSDPLFGSHLWEAYEGLYKYILEKEEEVHGALA